MNFDTTRALIIVGILSVIVAAGPEPSAAQVKLWLDFDDSSFVLRRDGLSGRESVEYLGPAFYEKARLTLTALGEPSPAGGQYLVLNGSSDFLRLPSVAAIDIRGQVAYSVSCWIFTPSDRTNGEIINASDNFMSGYRFYLEDNVPKLEMLEGASEVVSSGYRLEPRRWYHVGYFCDGIGDTVVMYVNGTPVAAAEFAKVTQVNTGPSTFVGAAPVSALANHLSASLDGLRFYVGKDSVFDDVAARIDDDEYTSRRRRTEPLTFELSQNYPNPFNLSTTISFELKRNGTVELQVYDMLGNMLKSIYSGELAAGPHDFSWEAQDKNGRALPSGIYFLRMSFNGAIQTKKMILVK